VPQVIKLTDRSWMQEGLAKSKEVGEYRKKRRELGYAYRRSESLYGQGKTVAGYDDSGRKVFAEDDGATSVVKRTGTGYVVETTTPAQDMMAPPAANKSPAGVWSPTAAWEAQGVSGDYDSRFRSAASGMAYRDTVAQQTINRETVFTRKLNYDTADYMERNSQSSQGIPVRSPKSKKPNMFGGIAINAAPERSWWDAVKGQVMLSGQSFWEGFTFQPTSQQRVYGSGLEGVSYAGGAIAGIGLPFKAGKAVGGLVNKFPKAQRVVQYLGGFAENPIVFAYTTYEGGRSLYDTAKHEGSHQAIRSGISMFQGGVAGAGVITQTGTRSLIKETWIKLGAKRVDAHRIFDDAVLAGEDFSAYTGSPQQSLRAFEATRKGAGYVRPHTRSTTRSVFVDNPNLSSNEFLVTKPTQVSGYHRQGYIEVVTASPKKLSSNTAQGSRKGDLGLEDSGVYVSPVGSGNPNFLRISSPDIVGESSVSMNIFKGLFDVPTVTRFKARAVERQPTSVVNQAGFEASTNWLAQQGAAQSGKVYITKRSEVGTGGIQKQVFELPSGRRTVESGTTELEGVIGQGQSFTYKAKGFLSKVKGYGEYTVVDSHPVAVRRATLNTKGNKVTGSSTRTISGKQVAREMSYIDEASTVKPVVGTSVVSIYDSSSVMFKPLESYSPSDIDSAARLPQAYKAPDVMSTYSKPPHVEQPSGFTGFTGDSGGSLGGGGSSGLGGGSSVLGGGSSSRGGGGSSGGSFGGSSGFIIPNVPSGGSSGRRRRRGYGRSIISRIGGGSSYAPYSDTSVTSGVTPSTTTTARRKPKKRRKKDSDSLFEQLVPFSGRYVPSVEGALKNVKGKDEFSAKTGLGLRGVDL
jgi:hypothetical protein